MTYAQRYIENLNHETRRRLAEANAEAAALTGERGVEVQIRAMSEQYKALLDEGRIDEAKAIKNQAIAIVAAAREA